MRWYKWWTSVLSRLLGVREWRGATGEYIGYGNEETQVVSISVVKVVMVMQRWVRDTQMREHRWWASMMQRLLGILEWETIAGEHQWIDGQHEYGYGDSVSCNNYVIYVSYDNFLYLVLFQFKVWICKPWAGKTGSSATLGLMASLASTPVFGDFKHLVLFYNMRDDKQKERKRNNGKGKKLLAWIWGLFKALLTNTTTCVHKQSFFPSLSVVVVFVSYLCPKMVFNISAEQYHRFCAQLMHSETPNKRPP